MSLSMLSSLILSLSCFQLFLNTVFAERPDFKIYSTRPEFRVPIFNIETYQEDQIFPGYWIFSAYQIWDLDPSHDSSSRLCAFGSYIVDGNGELIWSGACDFHNRNTYDIKVQSFGGKDYLTLMTKAVEVDNDGNDKIVGAGVLLNENYEIDTAVQLYDNPGNFNGHEFEIVEDGKSALAVYSVRKIVPTPDIGVEGQSKVVFDGFKEVEIATNKTLFHWSSEDHLSMSESSLEWLEKPTREGNGWDFVHMNSLHKFSNGDYLVSMRNMDTIYRINGVTGDIIWRLGGKMNDFELRGFAFSRQHFARVREEHGNGIYTISFFDNSDAGNVHGKVPPSNEYSSGRIITINENTMVAEHVFSIPRPDGQHSLEKGNFQFLPNGNYFFGWGEKGYQSEHAPDGSVIQVAHFKPSSTYRAYKFNFTGYPNEKPRVKSFVYGTDQDSLVTATYVSWNGATEVRSYNFYAMNEDSTSNDNDNARNTEPNDRKLIGNGVKNGFETLFMYSGYVSSVVAEALDANGKPLKNGLSEIATTEFPMDWHDSGFNPSETLPQPDVILRPQENEHSAGQENPENSQWQSFSVMQILGIGTLLVLVGSNITTALYLFRYVRRRKLKYDTVSRREDTEEALETLLTEEK